MKKKTFVYQKWAITNRNAKRQMNANT